MYLEFINWYSVVLLMSYKNDEVEQGGSQVSELKMTEAPGCASLDPRGRVCVGLCFIPEESRWLQKQHTHS